MNLLQFFTAELPQLLLNFGNVHHYPKREDKKPNMKKIYADVSTKASILLKSYSANYTRLLGEALSE